MLPQADVCLIPFYGKVLSSCNIIKNYNFVRIAICFTATCMYSCDGKKITIQKIWIAQRNIGSEQKKNVSCFLIKVFVESGCCRK